MKAPQGIRLLGSISVWLLVGCNRPERPSTAASEATTVDASATLFRPDGSPRDGGLSAFCRTSAATELPATLRVRAGSEDRVSFSGIYHDQSSGLNRYLRCVVRSAAEWQLFLDSARVDAPRSVDFSRQMVLIASSGRQSNTGYDIGIRDVWMRGDTVIARVHEEKPSADEPVGLLMVTPLAVVAVSRSPGPVFLIEQ